MTNNITSLTRQIKKGHHHHHHCCILVNNNVKRHAQGNKAQISGIDSCPINLHKYKENLNAK